MRESLQFYDALPKYKAELVDGQLYIGGSLAKSAMTLGYMVEKLGAQYVSRLVPKDLLQNAVIEVFGGGKPIVPLAEFTPVAPPYYPVQKLASDLRMGLYMQGADAWGGTLAVKLGNDVFMPDVYLLKSENTHRLQEYYLDGAPDLTIEVVAPYMRPFDFGARLERYAAAGLPEVWVVDFERRSFEPMRLEQGHFVKMPVENEVFASESISGLTILHQKLFDSMEERGMWPLQIFEVPETIKKQRLHFGQKADVLGWGSVPFAPRLDLQPVRITFEEYISWGGELKFEMVDGKPCFGGGDHTTQEWLGLLMMTLGVLETVKYLPAEAWTKVL